MWAILRTTHVDDYKRGETNAEVITACKCRGCLQLMAIKHNFYELVERSFSIREVLSEHAERLRLHDVIENTEKLSESMEQMRRWIVRQSHETEETHKQAREVVESCLESLRYLPGEFSMQASFDSYTVVSVVEDRPVSSYDRFLNEPLDLDESCL